MLWSAMRNVRQSGCVRLIVADHALLDLGDTGLGPIGRLPSLRSGCQRDGIDSRQKKTLRSHVRRVFF
jgi:hypothetical protein